MSGYLTVDPRPLPPLPSRLPPTGVHDACRVHVTPTGLLAADRPLRHADMLAAFLARVARLARRSDRLLRTGTAYLHVHDATPGAAAGDWHTDTGDAVRFVAAQSTAATPVAHQFHDRESLQPPNGHVVMFTGHLHRRPARPRTPTPSTVVFYSAQLAADDAGVDLSCRPLAGLAQPPVGERAS